jgi:hypothetical protein
MRQRISSYMRFPPDAYSIDDVATVAMSAIAESVVSSVRLLDQNDC